MHTGLDAPMLPLLQLAPGELATVPLLHHFAEQHPGVTIVTPHWHEEPWRADIAEGAIPGESPETSGMIGAAWPTGLLAKLEDLFGGGTPGPG